ncbi:MAG: hypothetical protein JSS14_04620 [Proteobacteria bacterium]|nr:hypothetical protein [Pseudomonadota bacterium]
MKYPYSWGYPNQFRGGSESWDDWGSNMRGGGHGHGHRGGHGHGGGGSGGGGGHCGQICGCVPEPTSKTATLGDRVWNDANGNGLQDAGETGRAGVRVELYEVQNTHIGALLSTQVTDAKGNYLFADLPPGDYTVRFVAPDGTVLTSANSGFNDQLDSDADASSGFSGIYSLRAGDQNTSVDAGIVSTTVLDKDDVSACEDDAMAFNVLANDSGDGLKLIGVAHESAALDAQFKAKGGTISFTADGNVNYQSMLNYYGKDTLVYTVQNAQGQVFTQKVDIGVNAVSDAPIAPAAVIYTWRHDSGDQFHGEVDGKEIWIHNYAVSEFSPFSDANDALQDFGGYNSAGGVASDIDSLKTIRLYGLTDGAQFGTVLFDGKPVDFSNGQTFDVTLDDIAAGRLDLQIIAKKGVTLNWTYVDTGDVQGCTACDGEIESTQTKTTIYTPVALDLNGDGHIGVTGATSSSQKDTGAPLGHTVQFDIDGDGKADTIEWFDGSGDGILVDNRDGMAGTQMDGTRLFGSDNGAFANGYDKLAQLDANGDGRLDGSELQGLLVWVDNGDAQVQDGELRTLGAAGIAAVSTQMHVTVDDQGRGHLESSATRVDGSELMSEDVFFARVEELPSPCDVIVGGDHTMDSLIGAAVPETAALAQAADVHDVSEAAELLRKIGAALHADQALV